MKDTTEAFAVLKAIAERERPEIVSFGDSETMHATGIVGWLRGDGRWKLLDVAYAAKRYGCRATIVMPIGTPLIKVNRTKSYGAEVILYGDVYDDACAYAYKLAEEHGYTFVHPFDDLDVLPGIFSVYFGYSWQAG